MSATTRDEGVLGSPEEAEAGVDIAAMRRAIVWGAQDNALIRECLEVAARHDLEEEEMYVWLAYQALIQLKKATRACASPQTPRVDRGEVKSGGTGTGALVDVDGHF